MSMPAIVSSVAAAADDVPTVFSARSDATSDATHNSTPAASTPSPRSGTLITCSFCIVDFHRQGRGAGGGGHPGFYAARVRGNTDGRRDVSEFVLLRVDEREYIR